MPAGGGGSPGPLAAPPPAPPLSGSDEKAAATDLGTRGLQGPLGYPLPVRSLARGPRYPGSSHKEARATTQGAYLTREREPGRAGLDRRGPTAGGVGKKAAALPAAASLPGRGLTPGDPGTGCAGTVLQEPAPRRGGFVTPEPRRPPERSPRLRSRLSLAPTLFSLRATHTKKNCISCLFYANMETRLTELLTFANKMNAKRFQA